MNPFNEGLKISNEYVAGFFDADGCIVIEEYENIRGRYQPRVRISNCHENLPKYLKEKYDGCICILKRKNTSPKWHDCYAWSTAGRKVLDLLKDISPFVIVKRKQIMLVFEFYNGFRNLHSLSEEEITREIIRRKSIKEQISLLNKTHGGS